MKTKARVENGGWKMAGITPRVSPSSILQFRPSLMAALALAGLCFIASAQNFGNTVVKDFAAVLENHKAPHETQMKSLLQGVEAEPQSDGVVLIRGLKLQTFTETGEIQMIVQAPECVFDTAHHTVSSRGHLDAQSGDGRFYFEGEGFLWQQTNSILIISNRVQTVIRDEPKKTLKK